MWAAQILPVLRPRTFLTSGGLGTMGYGIPAAIGAQIGQPDSTVVAVVGDGGCQMTGNELATIVAENLPVKIVVINNGCLGMVRQWQELFYDRRYFGVHPSGPDLHRLALAYGMAAERVSDDAAIGGAVDRAVAHPGPYFLECIVDPQANVFPIIPAGCGADSAIYCPPGEAPQAGYPIATSNVAVPARGVEATMRPTDLAVARTTQLTLVSRAVRGPGA
jgi:acetolactate synthase-1/2/3 large subunit